MKKFFCLSLVVFAIVFFGCMSDGVDNTIVLPHHPDYYPVDLCVDFVDGTTREHYGKSKKQFCDPRDGNKYVYVTIGTGATAQTWMAENLNYKAINSRCYGDNPANCAIYGRLYNWATAMAGTKYRGVCPSGWHIPSDADWNVLMKSVNPSCTDNSNCAGAGKKLKANSSLWNSNGKGTDDFGFSALPGGHGNSDGRFELVGEHGDWCSTSEISGSEVTYWFMDTGEDVIYDDKDLYDKSNLLSVRCLRN